MMRLASMLMALVVLWALYERLKDPGTWRLLVDEPPAGAIQAEKPDSTVPETIVSGSNDQDATEVAAIQDLLERVNDRAPLKPREMDAYWRLIDWSRTQSFAELERRASQDIAFTQLWEQPEKYRAKLIRLRMHVRRVLQYDAPENPSNISKVCEAWGWTDESRSFPYVVVFADPPADLPIGTDVRAEIEFVGYFLKVMSYTAFDHARGAPLLVGRARLDAMSRAAVVKTAPTNPWIVGGIVAGGFLLIAWTIWSSRRTRMSPQRKILPDDLLPLATLNAGQDPSFQLGDLNQSQMDTRGAIDLDFASDNDKPKPTD